MEYHFLVSVILLPKLCVPFLLPHPEYDVYFENTYPSATMSTKNPTWSTLRSNLGRKAGE